jgi:ectoine hydroxylase-related dioxygenase (phytanoyl-CoA dioxygenase family)
MRFPTEATERFQIDRSMHWSDHYVEHGFCVIKNALSKEFCERGIEEFKKALGTSLPPREWSTATLSRPHQGGRMTADATIRPFLETAYDQPGIRNMIETMYGSLDAWSGERACGPFLCVYDAENKPEVADFGHVDFSKVRIPVIGNSFVMQASLIDTEPFSGNITIYPGWHKMLQKVLLERPDFWYSDDGDEHNEWRQLMPKVAPYEFVAEAGDVLLMHHLVGHAGNINAAEYHTPRVAIHGQVIRKIWPDEIDATRTDLTPWERSLAHNGTIDLPFHEHEVQAAAYKERLEKRAHVIPART